MTFAPIVVEVKHNGPAIQLSRADNPMSYGTYNRPTYDGIDLIGKLPNEHIPTLENGRRLLVVGDIHGMLDTFEKLLKQADFDPTRDHVVAVGDMINKGPKSAELVTRLMDLNASAVRGNHEDRVILTWSTLNAQQGVAAYLDSDHAAKSRGEEEVLRTARSLSPAHMAWLRSLPVILTAEPMSLFIVHAGLVPGVPLHQQDPWAVMNMRALRFPREEFRKEEIERKKRLEEKKRKKLELERLKELEKLKELGKLKGPELKELEKLKPKLDQRAEPTLAADSTTVTAVATAKPSTDEPKLGPLNNDRDVWIPINDHDGERWTNIWNSEQKKLRGPDRRSVIYGHDAKTGYHEDSYTFGLDSGCVKGNSLTALIIQAKEDGGWKHSTIQEKCHKPKTGWW
ncbi:hypothetical protein FZEAL_371 [Fusarium zealandicum]|uniref:Calcineurin-like phosphoesterase domain-containing protein n=1 Tax=Fusarium zealandicum TaxID=1053134 RepID=A0A8H4XPV1_9HYPO|nr:hypothetical protein FZEAL_371 [Fusarium zealandicum]